MLTTIPQANAYGGVLLSRCGQILLREPTNHFDGYHWTFAKGKPDKNEQPSDTALREVYEETGYMALVVDALPEAYQSSLSSTGMFILSHLNKQHPFSWETHSTRWVSFSEAKNLVQQSTNVAGRARDLKILADVEAWFNANPRHSLPALEEYSWLPAKADDWRIKPAGEQFTTIALNFSFNAEQSMLIRMGFVPNEMEEKWFSYFEDNVLYQYRSWTGFCIDKIYFEPHKDGLLATHAKVSRNQEQYSETDDKADIERIRNQLEYLASAHQRAITLGYHHS